MSVRMRQLWQRAAAAGRLPLSATYPIRNLVFVPQSGSIHLIVPRRFQSSVTTESEKPLILGVGKAKTSTGLVGLAVEPDWYNVMLKKFQALLDKMEASDMPETAQYRIDVTKWCNYVLQQVRENPEDPEAVEDAVNMGQVEELIEMADDEMVALDAYLSYRMWELVEEAQTVVDFNPDPMKDPFAEDGDPIVQERLRKGLEPLMKEPKKN